MATYQQWNESKHQLGYHLSLACSIPSLYYSGEATKVVTRSLVVGIISRERFFKQVAIWELNKKRPCHRMKKRWRDVMRVDLQAISVYDRWYKYAKTGRHDFILCCDSVEEISASKQLDTCSANSFLRLNFKVCVCV